MRPSALMVASRALATAAGSATSQAIAVTASPSALAVFCASAMSWSQIATLAPDLTKRSVMALPKPCAPPVTTAVRPLRSMSLAMCRFSDVGDRGIGQAWLSQIATR